MSIGLTLIGQMLTFAIFVWFTMKFIWPSLEQALEERKRKIADGLAAAEKGREYLESAVENSKQEIQKAKERCNEIIAEAHKQALQIIEEAKQDARQEKENILSSGREMVNHELSQAKEKLQTKVADIIVLGAEKIISKTINADDHQILLDKLAKETVG